MKRYRIAIDVANVGVLENYRMDVVRGVIRYARQHTDWELLYNLGDFSLLHWYESFDDLQRLRADGIIFSYWESHRVEAIRRLGIPMVSLSNLEPEVAEAFPCVLSDDAEAGRLAARHFIDRGFRHYACYADLAGRRWEAERHRGFAEVLARIGYDCQVLSNQPFHNPPAAARQLAAWLATLPRPVALLAATDSRAYHVLESCQQSGLRVPEEIAIVGVDNNPFICEAQQVSISSVAPDGERVGVEAAGLLHRLMSGKDRRPETIVVPPRELVVRDSSDVVAADEAPLSRAVLFLRGHHHESIGIDDVVGASGVSRSTLERRFRARLGTTINETLRRMRLDTAKRLLTARELSLEEVAQRSGFRRATYLCHVFQELEGTTPREWQTRGSRG